MQAAEPVSRQDVLKQLHVLLRSADLESTTEERLNTQLSDHFKQDVTIYAQDIQAEIEKFVVTAAKQGLEEGNTKRDRENCDPDASLAKTAKVSKAAQSTGPFLLSEDGLTRCSVREFNGKTYVDVRNHFQKGDDVLPTKKGLMMSIPEWHAFAAAINDIRNAVAKKDTDYSLSISPKRRVTVTDFIKDTISVDLREYYGEGDEAKPSQKGIMLREPAFQVLFGHVDAVTASLGDSGAAVGAPSTTAAPEVKAAAPDGGAASASTAKAAVSSGPDGLKSVVVKSGETMWCLSSTTDRNVKLAGMNLFKEKHYVAVREYYQKDGAWMPGKKGLNLNQDQFETLCNHVQDISEAVAAKNKSLQVPLSDIRTVALNDFKGKMYVHLRESFDKGEDRDPCRGKGIGLSAEEWGVLATVIPKLQASLP